MLRLKTPALLYWLSAVLCACGGDPNQPSFNPTAQEPIRIILDTDFKDDVDDVGALAVLHALADLGEANILAVMVSTQSPCGGTAVDVINTYYARPDIPVGLRLPLDAECSALVFDPNGVLTQRYPEFLTQAYPHDLQIEQAPSAVDLYCNVLAAQPDNSVVIAAVGFLRNLADLLASDCPESELTALELIQAKVRRLEVMGGMYPAGIEFNFGADFAEYFEAISNLDPFGVFTSANAVINDWPGRVVFNGFEVGTTVQTGAPLFTQTPPGNPVREAYELYVGDGGTRSSWDLITVWHAIRGGAGLFEEVGQEGRNQGLIIGSNIWVPDPQNTKEHSYLTKLVSDAEIAAILDALLVQGPLLAESGERDHGEN